MAAKKAGTAKGGARKSDREVKKADGSDDSMENVKTKAPQKDKAEKRKTVRQYVGTRSGKGMTDGENQDGRKGTGQGHEETGGDVNQASGSESPEPVYTTKKRQVPSHDDHYGVEKKPQKVRKAYKPPATYKPPGKKKKMAEDEESSEEEPLNKGRKGPKKGTGTGTKRTVEDRDSDNDNEEEPADERRRQNKQDKKRKKVAASDEDSQEEEDEREKKKVAKKGRPENKRPVSDEDEEEGEETRRREKPARKKRKEDRDSEDDTDKRGMAAKQKVLGVVFGKRPAVEDPSGDGWYPSDNRRPSNQVQKKPYEPESEEDEDSPIYKEFQEVIRGGSHKQSSKGQGMFTSDDDDDEDHNKEIGQGERRRQVDGGNPKMTTGEGWIWTDEEEIDDRPLRKRVRTKRVAPKKKSPERDSDSREEEPQKESRSKSGRPLRDKTTPERKVRSSSKECPVTPDLSEGDQQEPPSPHTPTGRRRWTPKMESELVEMWKKEVYLYDSSKKKYRNALLRQDTLSRFATKLNITVHELETRMKSMRTTFTKVTNPYSGSGADSFTARAKQVANMLTFLHGHVNYRETLSNGKKKKKASTNNTRTIYTSQAAEMERRGETPQFLNMGGPSVGKPGTSSDTQAGFAENSPPENDDDLQESPDDKIVGSGIKANPKAKPTCVEISSESEDEDDTRPVYSSKQFKNAKPKPKDQPPALEDSKAALMGSISASLSSMSTYVNEARVNDQDPEMGWARLLGIKVRRMSQGIGDKFKVFVDSLAVEAMNGNWSKELADQMLRALEELQ